MRKPRARQTRCPQRCCSLGGAPGQLSSPKRSAASQTSWGSGTRPGAAPSSPRPCPFSSGLPLPGLEKAAWPRSGDGLEHQWFLGALCSTAYFAPQRCSLLFPIPFFLPSPGWRRRRVEEDEEGVCHPALPSEGMRWCWDTIQEVKGTPGFWCLCRVPSR